VICPDGTTKKAAQKNYRQNHQFNLTVVFLAADLAPETTVKNTVKVFF
jgi:hypothetical protein